MLETPKVIFDIFFNWVGILVMTSQKPVKNSTRETNPYPSIKHHVTKKMTFSSRNNWN